MGIKFPSREDALKQVASHSDAREHILIQLIWWVFTGSIGLGLCCVRHCLDEVFFGPLSHPRKVSSYRTRCSMINHNRKKSTWMLFIFWLVRYLIGTGELTEFVHNNSDQTISLLWTNQGEGFNATGTDARENA